MADLTMAQRIAARIAALDAEIERVRTHAREETATLQADRAMLVRAGTALAGIPDGEALIEALRKVGL